MRQVTEKAVDALMNRENMKCGNTEVRSGEMFLHGNRIAWLKNGRLWITNCGYKTNVTKERLNGLPNVNIFQRNYEWFLNGQSWNGEPIEISL